jgi:MFS family permease
MSEEASAKPTSIVRPFSWFYGWNVLLVAVPVVAMAMGIVISAFTFFALKWMEEFGSSRGETMLILSATQIAAGFLLPFSGRAMDRYSMRKIGIGGILCLSSGLALASFATQLWHLFIIYALVLGAAEALIGQIYAQTQAAKWFVKKKGFALALASLGSSVGALIFPALIAFMLTDISWRATMQIMAVAVVVLAVPAILLVIREAPVREVVKLEKVNASVETEWTTMKVVRSFPFWCIVLGFLPLFEATAGLTSNLGHYTQDIGIDIQRAGFLLSIWSITVILGKILFGILADHFDQRVLFYVSWVPTVVGLILLQLQPGFAMMAFTMVMFGLGSGSHFPLIGIMISRSFGAAAFGTVMGLFYLCIRPVSLAAPIAGWVRDTFGTYDYFWIGVIVLALLTAPLIIFVKERTHR